MKNKKIAVLAVAAVLSMGSLTAAAHGTDNHGTGYERLDHNQLSDFQRWCEFNNTFPTSTSAGNSYDRIHDSGAQLIHKVDYDAFMASRWSVKPLSDR